MPYWSLISPGVLPLGIEYDFFLWDEAIAAYEKYCKDYPNDSFALWRVDNADEPNEKWTKILERIPAPPLEST